MKNLGAEIYNLNTKNGTTPITKEVATLMTVDELEEVLLHTYDANMDFVTDVVALETVMNCCQVLAKKTD